MKPYAILLFIPFLAGCPALDAMEGKPSPAKAEVERRAALTLPEPVNLADAVAPVAVIQPVLFVQSVQEVETQPCNPVFRISYCENGKEVMF